MRKRRGEEEEDGRSNSVKLQTLITAMLLTQRDWEGDKQTGMSESVRDEYMSKSRQTYSERVM